MEENKVENVINIIKDMNIKDKLRLAICMNDSQWLTLDYDKREMYNKFDTHLRKIDEEYRTTLMNFGQSKYFIINFTMQNLLKWNKLIEIRLHYIYLIAYRHYVNLLFQSKYVIIKLIYCTLHSKVQKKLIIFSGGVV